MVMMWMEFECEASFVAEMLETRQHFFYFLPIFYFTLLFWEEAPFLRESTNGCQCFLKFFMATFALRIIQG